MQLGRAERQGVATAAPVHGAQQGGQCFSLIGGHLQPPPLRIEPTGSTALGLAQLVLDELRQAFMVHGTGQMLASSQAHDFLPQLEVMDDFAPGALRLEHADLGAVVGEGARTVLRSWLL